MATQQKISAQDEIRGEMQPASEREAVQARSPSPASDPLWYKDAVIYQLHVKSFFDANDDGIGDFAGLLAKLDYIASLGVTCIWLLPFYPSPRRDDGYDIAEYRAVHPEYGRMSDFRRFVAAAHARGLKVITELVINHTSDQHRWFQRARRARPGTAARDFYVWSDTDERYQGTRIIFCDTEKSNWTWDPEAKAYFWHRFYSHQPDLNFDNPRVLREVLSVMRFWLDAGVDGMRLDAVPYLIEREGTNNENLPETHLILKQIRKELDSAYEGRMLLAEANMWPEDTQQYFGENVEGTGGDECHMAFHFPLMPRMYMAIAQEDRFPITDIMRQTPDIPHNCQWAIFLRNHDELTLEMVTDSERDYLWSTYAADRRARINLGIRRRLAPLMQRDRRRIELMNCLLFTMPGTPVLYYGDEIGMGDNIYLGDRDGVRTPMQWSSDRNGGFSRADPARLTLPAIMDPVFGYQSVNVEAQEPDQHSLLNWTRRMLAVRQRHQAFGRGTIRFLRPANRKILAYLREHEGATLLCVANLSRAAQAVELHMGEFAGRTPVELTGSTAFPQIGQLPYMLTLPPYGFYWFELCEATAAPDWSTATAGPVDEPYTFVLRAGVHGLSPRDRTELEQNILPAYVARRRWFQRKDQEVRRVSLAYATSDWAGGPETVLCEIDVTTDAGTERYVLPIGVAWEADQPPPFAAQLAMARVRRFRHVGLLTDGFALPAFARGLLASLAASAVVPLPSGELRFEGSERLAEFLAGAETDMEWLAAEQTNSTMVIGRKIVLKLIRKAAPGIHPEVEMNRLLTERGYANVSPYLGRMVRVDADGTSTALALAQGFVFNQGNGWDWTLSFLERTADEASRLSEGEAPGLLGPYEQFAAVLGRRLGELHMVLAEPTDDPDFAPVTAGPAEAARVRDSVMAQLEEALAILGRQQAPSEDAARLLAAADELRAAVERLSGSVEGTTFTRIHGDFHLGQLLVAGSEVILIDFEGEPAKPLEERRAKASPMRDVAGTLRSFAYAAAFADRHRATLPTVAEAEGAIYLGERFRMTASRAFLAGYAKATGSDPTGAPLLDLFLLEKAAYEIAYEAANRPDWLAVPVSGFAALAGRLLGRGDGRSSGTEDR